MKDTPRISVMNIILNPLYEGFVPLVHYVSNVFDIIYTTRLSRNEKIASRNTRDTFSLRFRVPKKKKKKGKRETSNGLDASSYIVKARGTVAF